MSHNFSWHTSNESNRLLSLLAVILCCVALLKSIYHIRDERKNNSDGTRFIALIGSNCKEYSFYFFYFLVLFCLIGEEKWKYSFLLSWKIAVEGHACIRIYERRLNKKHSLFIVRRSIWIFLLQRIYYNDPLSLGMFNTILNFSNYSRFLCLKSADGRRNIFCFIRCRMSYLNCK